jgi:hypothetical protein
MRAGPKLNIRAFLKQLAGTRQRTEPQAHGIDAKDSADPDRLASLTQEGGDTDGLHGGEAEANANGSGSSLIGTLLNTLEHQQTSAEVMALLMRNYVERQAAGGTSGASAQTTVEPLLSQLAGLLKKPQRSSVFGMLTQIQQDDSPELERLDPVNHASSVSAMVGVKTAEDLVTLRVANSGEPGGPPGPLASRLHTMS